MSLGEIFGLGITLLVMCVGIIGSIVPGIPGAGLVLAAALGHKLWFGTASASWLVLMVLAALALLSLVLDYLATLVGAKKMGATWRGAVGASVGCIIGMFFGPPGLILCPFLGALALEMAGGRKFEEATQAGVGAMLGLLAGAVGKLACCLAMTGLFAANAVIHSWR